MTTNVIKKKCPKCGHTEADICGVIILNFEKEDCKKSFNDYKCLKCKRHFKVERSDDKAEQELTEKYIKSASIKLKKN